MHHSSLQILRKGLQMEECVSLVYESLGVSQEDDVAAADVCLLYQRVFLQPGNQEQADEAITQVSGQDEGCCAGQGIMDALLQMERDRVTREELHWEVQMMRAGRFRPTIPCSSHNQEESQERERGRRRVCVWRLRMGTKRLCIRLCLEGLWNVLPSLRHGNEVARGRVQQRWARPSHTDVLLLLEHKYDIIRERLYREMLQEEHGVACWAGLLPWQQRECVEELGEAAEHALSHGDLLRVCDLPGAFCNYRCGGEVELRGCGAEGVKLHEQAWLAEPCEEAWSAVVFLSELQTHYQHEHTTLTSLVHRLERAAMCEVCVCVCVAAMRAERETHSHTALLAARQHWERWPSVRGPVSRQLVSLWLQDPSHSNAAACTLPAVTPQAVLQGLVLCQEQDRKCLVELLHGVSLDDLQGPISSGLPGLREACVLRLRQGRRGDAAMLLITQLTHTHNQQASALAHTLLQMDQDRLMGLKEEYESELKDSKHSTLTELLLQPTGELHTAACKPRKESERREEDKQEEPSANERAELCTACGALVSEEIPYLEILGGRSQSDGQPAERRGEEEETRGEEEERRGGGEEGERRGGEEEEEKRRGGEEEERSARDASERCEKQGSLITLAWSKPAHSASQDQEVTSAPQEEEVALTEYTLPEHTHKEHMHTEHTLPEHTLEQEQGPSSKGMEETHTFLTHTPDTHTLLTHPPDTCTLLTQTEYAILGAELPLQGKEHHLHEAELPLHGAGLLLYGVELPLEGAELHLHGTELPLCGAELPLHGAELPLHDAALPLQGAERPLHEAELPLRGAELPLQGAETMRSLVDMQRKVELRFSRHRERQMLRVQERLSIIQTRKSNEDLLSLTQTDTLKHLTHLTQEEEKQQKSAVREKLQQLRRERSYILQTRRERNTAGFKELLGPIEREDNP